MISAANKLQLMIINPRDVSAEQEDNKLPFVDGLCVFKPCCLHVETCQLVTLQNLKQ